MNEINTVQIIKGFLTDVAEISWCHRPLVAGGHDSWFSGTFPARLDSLYHIGLYTDNLFIWTGEENKEHFNIHFLIEESSLRWMHTYSEYKYYDKPRTCHKSTILSLADPKFFQNFIQVICLNLCEPKISEFILRRIINKPKFKAMCPESKMRHCRRYVKHVMSCEEVNEFVWKS